MLAGDLNWRKYLSNFQDIPDGFSWDGRLFPNVEHAFHYEKFKRTDKPELGERYVGKPERGSRLLGSYFETNAKAKMFSGRKTMGENGATLDVGVWNVERVGVSAALLKARWEQDDKFRSILLDSKVKGIRLIHFERGTRNRPPFWGAFKLRDSGDIIGKNMLGKQMMELRDVVAADSPQLVLQRVAQSNNWMIGDLGRKEDPYASFIEEVDKIPLQDYSAEYKMIDGFFGIK